MVAASEGSGLETFSKTDADYTSFGLMSPRGNHKHQ